MAEPQTAQQTIVIVDDNPRNLTALEKLLAPEGYRVYQARDGSTALETITNVSPDLILLDILLPETDGYDLCRRVKADTQTQDIPVLFISALEDTLDRVKAFDAGGVDYIAKPFHADEVLARIRTHLSLRDSRKRLQENNRRLHQELTERERVERIQAALYRISEATQSTPHLDDLFPAIRDIVGTLMPVENFYIAFYDADTAQISFPYYIEDNVLVKRPPRPCGQGLAEYVLRTGIPLLLTPAIREDLIQQGEMKPISFTPKLMDWLGVPLISQNRIIGLLNVQSHSPDIRFGEREKNLLRFVSSQIALAIERKRSEELLYKLEAAIDTTEVGMTITDPEKRIIYVNPADARMHGYSPDELIGQPANIFSFPEARGRKLGSLSDDEEVPLWKRERINVRKDGSTFPVKLMSNPIYSEQGELLGKVTICEDITVRKQSERLLRESEERYRGLFENATIGIFQATPDGQFLTANPELAQMLGYAAVSDLIEAVGNVAEDLYCDPQHWYEVADIIRAMRETVSVETRWRHKDGGKLVIHLSIWAVHDEYTKVRYFEGIVDDITERKQMERMLFQQATLLRCVARAQIGLLINPDLDEAISEALELLGFTTETDRICIFENQPDSETGDIMMTLRYEWVKDETDARIQKPAYRRIPYHPAYDRWHETLNAQQIIHCPVRLLPKSERKLFTKPRVQSIMLIPIMVGERFWGFIGFEDFYEERQWREEEKSSLAAIAGSIGGALARQQAEADLIAANAELKTTLDNLTRTQSQLVLSEKMAALGQLIAGIAHEINTPLGAIRSSIGDISTTLKQTLAQLPAFFHSLPEDCQEAFFALMKEARSKDGTLSPTEKRTHKRKLIDMLQQHQLENPRKIAEMLVDIGVYEHIEPFLPLIQSPDYAQILTMAYRLSGLRESTHTISTAVERASKVAFALKRYTHYDQSGQRVETDITIGIDTVLTLYYNKLKHGVDVVREYEQLPLIPCYPDELNQVWTNLIHNALYAMDYEGTLTIHVSQQNGQAVIAITDTGKGIPEELQGKIFDPFFTTKPQGEGSGLGLDIVKKIIDKHHGRIEVESQPGNTTFQIILPIS